MTVFVQNLTINARESFSRDLDILSADGTGGVDLTGYTANSHLRKHTDSSLSAVIIFCPPGYPE